jgi:hypothetical protein
MNRKGDTTVRISGRTIILLLIILSVISGMVVAGSMPAPMQKVLTFFSSWGITGDATFGVAGIEDLDAVIIDSGSCAAGYTDVLHLSNRTNGHAELPSASNYSIKVCVGDTSGRNTFTTDSAGTNFVKLSNVSNAHAEQANYSNYGSLAYVTASLDTVSCQYTDTSGTCDANQTCLGTLSAGTNAHYGDCSAYNRTICCGFTTENNAPPTVSNVVLATPSNFNSTAQNLTVTFDVTDLDNDSVKNITVWKRNGTSISLLHMPFEGGSNSTFTKDYSGAGNDGAVIGATWNDTDGYDGYGAYEFDGVNDFINLSNKTAHDFSTSFSVTAWIKWQNSSTHDLIVGKDSASPRDWFISVRGEFATDNLYFEFFNATQGPTSVTSSSSVTIDQWNFVSGTFDGTSLRLYLNGVLETELNTTQVPAATGNDLLIGRQLLTGTYFNGSIDEIVIWNESLSAEQIAALYANRTDLIVSQETFSGDVWQACVTPNDGSQDGAQVCSNTLTIAANVAPVISSVLLNATTSFNSTADNLTAYVTELDPDGDDIKDVFNWYLDGESYGVLNLPFESDGVNNRRDYSSFNYSSTAVGTTHLPVGGYDGFGAYSFDGIDDYLQFSTFPQSAMKTASVWLINGTVALYAGPQDNNGYQRVSYSGQLSQATVQIRNPSSSHYRYWITNGTVWNQSNITYPIHLVWIQDDLETPTVFANGIEQHMIISQELGTPTRPNGTNLWINRYSNSGTQYSQGVLDEILIFNHTISSAQALALYNNRTDLIVSAETASGDVWQACVTPNDGMVDGNQICSNNFTVAANVQPIVSSVILNATTTFNSTADNLTAYVTESDPDGDDIKDIYNWYRNDASIAVLNMPFEGHSGDESVVAKDYTPFGNNGTVVNATWNQAGGYDGNGVYSFDGANDYINLNDPAELDFGTGNFTVTVWVYITKTTPINNEWGIIAKTGNAGAFANGWAIEFSSWGNSIGCYFTRPTSLYQSCGGFTVPSNTWVHIAMTRYGNTVDLYKNGVLNQSTTHADLGINVNNTKDLRFAENVWNQGLFGGKLDDVAIWDRSLSPEQIFALYNNRTDLIVSQETSIGEIWQACMTPNDGTGDGSEVCSNTLTVTTDIVTNVISGNESSVTTSGVTALNITLDGSDDLSGDLSGNHFMTFFDGAVLLMNFTHNFSAGGLDLSQAAIVTSSRGIVVNLSNQLSSTKTLYLTDSGFSKICADNTDIGSLNDISGSCSEVGETLFTVSECVAGTTRDGITCSQSGSLFVLSGLNHSGVGGGSPPNITSLVLNSTFGTNKTTENLTAYTNATDPENDTVKLIHNWFVDGQSMAVLNMPFEGHSGNESVVAKDYTPFGNNGTVVNATWNQTGGYDGWGAYEFNADGYINAGNSTSLALSTYTIAFWYNLNTNDTYYRPLDRSTGGVGAQTNYLATIGPTVGAGFGNGTSNFQVTSSLATYGGFHLLTSSFNNATGNLTLYIDGVLMNSTFVNATPYVEGSQLFKIGASDGSASAGVQPLFAFNGSIDEVKIYDRALSVKQILALYNNRTDLIVSQETSKGQTWSVEVTPNDGGPNTDGPTVTSGNVTILNSLPSATVPVLNSTAGSNKTTENLTAYSTTSDIDNDTVKKIHDWKVDGQSFAVLNMPFEGHSGNESTVAKDYSGNGNNGTVIGATWNQTGGYDGFGAYEFDGTGNIISFGDVLDLERTESRTFEFRVNMFVNGLQFILAKQDNFGVAEGYAIQINDSGSVFFNLANDQTTSGITVASTDTIVSNTDTHIIVSYDGSSNASGVKIYIDGVSSPLDVYVNNLDATTVTSEDLRFGCREGCTFGNLNGTLDDVRMYNHTLSPQQVSALYNNRTDLIVSQETTKGETWSVDVTPNDGADNTDGPTVSSGNVTILNSLPSATVPVLNSTLGTNFTTENLTAYSTTSDADNDSVKKIHNWFVDGSSLAVLNMPFEGHSGDESAVAKDYSPSNNDGTVTSATWNETGGYDGFGAYEFDGSNDFIQKTSPNGLPIGAEPRTISLWFKPGKNLTASTESGLIQYGTTSTSKLFGLITSGNAPGKLYFFGQGNDLAGVTTLQEGVWYHGAVTYDGSNLTLYVNGNIENSAVKTLDTVVNGNGLTIGLRPASTRWTGTIDDVTIFNRALSPKQIEAIYNNRTDLIVSQETDKDEVWSVDVTPNDGAPNTDGPTVSSGNLTIVNFVPTAPVLLTPTDGNDSIVDRTPTLRWNNSIDTDPDTVIYEVLVATDAGFTTVFYNNTNVSESIDITNVTVGSILPVDDVYYWKVRAYDGYNYSNYSTTFNFTLNSFLAAGFAAGNASFAAIEGGFTRATDTGDAEPLVIENTGNVFLNITLLGGQLFSSAGFPSDTYQYRAAVNESGAFNTTLSQLTYANVTNSSSVVDIVSLNWQDAADAATVHIRISPETDEPPGNKTSTLVVVVS